MGRYPREIRAAAMKCIPCNAPVAQSIDGRFACVECGREPIKVRTETDLRIGASDSGMGINEQDQEQASD